jgi:hypothetical protein
MYNLRARYYDTTTGRFNQRDTFSGYNDDPQSIHKYLYCTGDPIDCIDPSGQQGLISLLLGFAIDAIITIRTYAVVIYEGFRLLEAVQKLIILADGIFEAWQNYFLAPPSIPTGWRITIGFVAGVIQGSLAFQYPTLANFTSSLFEETANAIASKDKFFRWATLWSIVKNVTITTFATYGAEKAFGEREIDAWNKFFLAFDLKWATLETPEFLKLYES